MKSNNLVVSLIFFAVVGLIKAVDFCAYSCSGTANIGCNNNGAFGSSCPASKKIITMTAALKKVILDKHNGYRNKIAAGNLTGFKPAVKMATMRWNADLALLAEYNVRTCLYAHDACRNTPTFNWAGQNIAKTWWNPAGGASTYQTIFKGFIDLWWGEYKNAVMAQLNSYPSTSPAKTIGHFTVMTADKNMALGCAAVQFPDTSYNNWDAIILTCNYARTNVIGYQMYVPGKTASKCLTGKNPNFPALCSLKETIAVNTLVKV